MSIRLIPLALLFISAPALAGDPAPSLKQQVETVLATAPSGTRWGLLVVDEEGREVVALNPDQRFIPASNTKLFSTAAALALLPGMDQPDADGGTRVILDRARGGTDVVLLGRGDARMSSAPDCKVDCLATLADAVAAKTSRVHNVIGEDTFWPDQRWAPGMSWNNIGTDSGTAVSALNLDDNELQLVVTPTAPGKPPKVVSSPYFRLQNDARTTEAEGKRTLTIERAVNGFELRIYGEIPADARPWTERIGIDDPAHYAAWVFKGMLEARGVKVTGKVQPLHRPPGMIDRPCVNCGLLRSQTAGKVTLASLVPPPLADDVLVINKVSQNLHAQVLFRRVGGIVGTGSEQWSVDALNTLLTRAGVPRAGYDFSDGSGMSTYNRVSPRAAVALLCWGKTQPWGTVWRDSLPIGGVDGTLRRRFAATPLQGKVRAKTGTLNATNALSGYLTTASGRELTFSIFANDVPDGTNAVPAMDAALLAVAAAL